jgi:hypothetical protein
MADYDEPVLTWRKSARSNSGGCLEIAVARGIVLLRDSKRPDGFILSFTPHAWVALVAEVRRIAGIIP